jgi:hypothetical protein
MTTVFLEGDSRAPNERVCSLGWDSVAPDERVCSLGWDSAHQKPGAEAARQLADLRFPSLIEATEALLNQSVKI